MSSIYVLHTVDFAQLRLVYIFIYLFFLKNRRAEISKEIAKLKEESKHRIRFDDYIYFCVKLIFVSVSQ